MSYIDDAESLSRTLSALAQDELLALDSEFVRESTYFPKLCLVQIAARDLVACIDCLAEIDTTGFLQWLTAPSRTWLVHSARQDLEAIWVRCQRVPARIVDTQIAAALLGHAPQVSLQTLLADKLDIGLDKQHARTDWARRPLSGAEVRYALDDVRFLPQLWQILERELDALGRREWFEQDCRTLLTEPLTADPLEIWARLPGVGALGAAQQAAALCLVEWREETARRLDRPRRWILQDSMLLDLAGALPSRLDELARIASLPRKLVQHSGADLLAALEARHQADIRALVTEHMGRELPDRNRVKALQQLVRQRAGALGMSPEVLATRREITSFVCGRGAARTPWRVAELERLLSAA